MTTIFELTKLAVQQDASALKNAPDDLKNNYEIVQLAVQQDASALRYASNDLKNNYVKRV